MRPCPRCGHPMEQGRPHAYCGKCGYSERFGPPAGAAHAPSDGPTSYGFVDVDDRDTPNGELTAAALAALRGNWGVAIGALLLYFIVVSLIGAVPILGAIALGIVGGPFMVGVTQFYLGLSRGERPEVDRIFRGFDCFGTAFCAYWLMGIFVFLWALLFIVPGIVKAFAYAMTYMIIADNPELTATEALRLSQEMMDGNKAKLFRLCCRFIPWAIVSVLTFGIGFLWLVPYIFVSLAKFYDDIKS